MDVVRFSVSTFVLKRNNSVLSVKHFGSTELKLKNLSAGK